MFEREIIDFKKIVKERDKYKGYFRSRGYSDVLVTYIDENGEQKQKIVRIPIQPLGDHPLIKEFQEKYKPPKPPIKRVIVDISTGEPVDGKVAPEEIRRFFKTKYDYGNIYDFTDENYIQAKTEYEEKLLLLYLMIALDVVDEFGIDKIDEFKQFLEDLGFTYNQLSKIAEDIRNLDFLPAER